MIRLPARLPDSATPRMIALSLLLHGTVILAIIVFAYSSPRFQKLGQGGVSRVRIVESVSAPPVVEKLRTAAPSQREIPLAVENTPAISESSRQKVAANALKAPPKDSIRLAKRKKAPRRVKAPKPQEKKVKQAVQKKEDSQAFLDKRLAAIRQEVENKKGGPANSSDAAGREETGAGAALADKELLRWLDMVKSRINSNWSVLADNRTVSRVTIIGVKLGHDGRVQDVAIDESSGDEAFDRSAIRAVLQAAPLPPLTPETREKVLRAGGLALRFTPRGLQ
jgi:colicin import membrane protein